MLIGTAGHIDHGKTALVRALTGVDTDRLPEEKKRGISIELGYAYQALPGGGMLGFIDVPGHEKFVHTMLAGAAGIDFGLLVVAADDGVMPQTREHLAILTLLGIRRGAVALTKIDRVDAARADAATREVQALLADTPLAAAPVFPVDALHGAGVAALHAWLVEAAAQQGERASRGAFRLSVDRSFTLTGVGTVVTGTVFSGRVQVGDRLLLSPSGREVRVRSLHADNRAGEAGHAGQRCALALAGVARDEVARGDWVLAPALHAPCKRVDLRLRLLPDATALGQWTRVHVHHGASHLVGNVLLLDRERLAPGEDAFVQLVLEVAGVFSGGDAVVLRDACAQRTIGGARVLDPDPPLRHRRSPARLAQLAAEDTGDAHRALAARLAISPYGVDRAAFARKRNLETDALGVPDGALPLTGEAASWVIGACQQAALIERILATLAAFHERTPDEMGPDAARLRRMVAPDCAAEVFSSVLAQCEAAGQIRRSGPWLHLPTHNLTLDAADEALAAQALSRLQAGRFDPPWMRELALETRTSEEAMRRLLLRLSRRGDLFQIVRDLFYTREAVQALAQIAAELAEAPSGVQAAAFRDRAGIGRKRAIQILEFFDRVGYTRRARDAHCLRSDSLLQLGAAGEGR